MKVLHGFPMALTNQYGVNDHFSVSVGMTFHFGGFKTAGDHDILIIHPPDIPSP